MVILDVAAFAAHRTETEHAGIELPESLRDQELSGDTTPLLHMIVESRRF